MNPLDQLADIATPSAVSIWPLAWGYWLALALILAILAYSIFVIVQFRRRRKIKREAMASLDDLALNNEYYAHRVQVLMKSLCSHYLPLSSSAQMHGAKWQTIVLSVYRGKDTEGLIKAIDLMFNALYAPEQTSQQDDISRNKHIQTAIKEWMTISFPCKQRSGENPGVRISQKAEVHNA